MDQPWITIALLGAVIFLFAFIQTRGAKTAKNQSGSLQEIEEAFEHFVQEIEEDNRKVMEHVTSLKAAYEQRSQLLSERLESHAQLLNDRIQQLEQHIQAMEQAAAATTPPLQTAKHAVNEASTLETAIYDNSAETTVIEADTIRHRYQSIFDMHHEGRSIEYIAKKMGMNKGEVQLVLTLAQQEEANRAES